MRVGVILALLCVLFPSCTHPPLRLYSEFVDKKSLASYKVKTPDPLLDCPDIGQRLYISWRLPKQWRNPSLSLSCVVTTRFYNEQESCWLFPLTSPKGMQTIAILNEDYTATGGIATFKAELKHNTITLYQWCHQLWNETIEIAPPSPRGAF